MPAFRRRVADRADTAARAPLRCWVLRTEDHVMRKHIIGFAAAAALAFAPLASHALGTNEKGCLVGGAAGGLAGHAIAGKGAIGAAVGCGAGILINKQRVKKIDAEKEANKQKQAAAHERAKRRQLAQHHPEETVR
jgi:hypothetical protein